MVERDRYDLDVAMRFALGFLVGAALATFGPFAGALAGAALHERNLRRVR